MIRATVPGWCTTKSRRFNSSPICRVVCGGGRAHLRVGGGVVADSDPQAEYDETIDKARALLSALGAVLPRG